MTLKFIMDDLFEKFIKVVEAGNLTQAAKKLYVTQPALSIAIKHLEKRIGCKLLIRGQKGVEPTELGKIVYEFAKKQERNYKNLKKEIAEKNEEISTRISMGMIDNVGLVFISEVYKDFLRENPNLNLQIQVDNSKRLIEKTEIGNIDFAIITKGKRKLPSNMHQEDFASEEMIIVGKPPFVSQTDSPKDLEKVNFITYNKDSTTFKIIDNTFKNSRININYAAYSSSPDFIIEMVKQGTGLAVLPRNLVENEIRLENMEKIQVDDISFTRKLSLIHLKDTYLPNTTKSFIKELRKLYEN